MTRPNRCHLSGAFASAFIIAVLFMLAWASPALAVPDIRVSGGGNEIVNGDTTPETADRTDFGGQPVSGGTNQNTFAIENTGADPLTIASVTLTGAHAGDFSITTDPSGAPIAAAGSANLQILFDPSAEGLRSATVNITSDDPDESPYTFAIQGMGGDPDIDVQGRGISIPDGHTTPAVSDDTDFGDVAVGSSVDHTFTIRNTGLRDLTLNSISFPSPAWSFVSISSVNIAPGGAATLTLRFRPTAAQTYTCAIAINSNDPDESPYDFTLRGTGFRQDIDLRGNGISIVNGDATPSTADHTNFGSVDVSSGTMVRTFTIANTGIENLNLTGAPMVAISGAAAGDFTVTTQPTTPVLPSATTTFDVTFDPSAAGVRSATISIGSDDPDENPYTFAIQGYGSTPGSGTPDPEPEPEPDPAPKPGSPKGTSPSPTTSMNGPSISWPSVSGARAYRVYRAACPTCPKQEIGRVSGTSFVDQSALPGQVYYYYVRGEGSGGLSDYSDWMAAWRYEQNPGRAGDFNGDGITDLLWWEPDTNQLTIWLMNGGVVQSVTNPGAGQDISQWLLINTGDFNNDGVCDIMWWNPQAGAVEVWYMAASSSAASGAGGNGFQATSSPGQITGNSTLSYTGDLNGDGREDILWRDYETGQITLWIMGADGQPTLNGPPTLATGMSDGNRPDVTGSLEWGVRGLHDMDGDGKADVIWQHASDGRVVVWRMNGSQAIGIGEVRRAQPDNWLIAGMGDLDGDGMADFVWSNQADGAIQTWLMHGLFTDELVIVDGSTEAAKWQVKAVGDFCAAGSDDIYCKHSESSAVRIVKLDGQEFAPSVE